MRYYKKHKIGISGGIIITLFILSNFFFDKYSHKSDLDITVNELTETLWIDETISNEFGKVTQVKVDNFILSPYYDTLKFSCQLNHIHSFDGIFIRHQKKIIISDTTISVLK